LAANDRHDSRVHLIAPLPSSHEGSCGQVANQHFICLAHLAPFVSDPWPEPINHTRHRGRVTSHPVAAGDGRTIIPHAQGIGLGKAGPTLIAACRSHEGKRPTNPAPARMINLAVTCRLLWSGSLECCAYRQIAQGRVTPERDQELACQRHDRDPADAATLRSHAVAEPAT
jgi:hypothetical protein